MDIKLHNTLSNKKEVFSPLKKEEVSMYHCGPTVYNFPTIGNMRSYVFADTLRRTFEYFGYKVKQVINITDVGHLVSDGNDGEDKMEKSAKKEGRTVQEIAEFYENEFYKDLDSLNINTENTLFPKASQHIPEQIEIIKLLEEKGMSYKTSDGIYFDTSKFPDYGKLGNINIEGEKEGARIGVNDEKRNKADFALWKFSPLGTTEKRLQEWESPWGIGFPGWHIECSAMSRRYLGQPFDIHTGGIDHIPVHHNNEIAQSEAAYGLPLSNIWMHNEFLKVDGEKMSKSLGNTYTLQDLKIKKIHPASFRYWLLCGKYNTQINFTWEGSYGAQTALEKLLHEYNNLSREIPENLENNLLQKFEEALADDLNTPVALALLNQAASQKEIETMDKILGLNIVELAKQITVVSGQIRDLQKERDEARLNNDYHAADNLRDTIEHLGFQIKDSGDSSVVQNTLSNLSQR